MTSCLIVSNTKWDDRQGSVNIEGKRVHGITFFFFFCFLLSIAEKTCIRKLIFIHLIVTKEFYSTGSQDEQEDKESKEVLICVDTYPESQTYFPRFVKVYSEMQVEQWGQMNVTGKLEELVSKEVKSY